MPMIKSYSWNESSTARFCLFEKEPSPKLRCLDMIVGSNNTFVHFLFTSATIPSPTLHHINAFDPQKPTMSTRGLMNCQRLQASGHHTAQSNQIPPSIVTVCPKSSNQYTRMWEKDICIPVIKEAWSETR